MGRVDIATKRFVSIVDVFAQLFNVGLFQGDIVVKEDGLTDMNPLEDMRLEKGKVSKKLDLRERIRDVKKKSDLGFTLAILGVEDQDAIHYYMPVRAMLYDASAYDVQFKELIEDCERNGVNIPIGAGVPKGSQVLPVITIVLYTGSSKWDGPRDLFDLLQIPEEKKSLLAPYMNNYHIHVIDARHLTDEEINQYEGDLKAFFIMLRDRYDEEMLRGVIARHRETWYAVSTIKNDDRYKDYIDTVDEQELQGGVNMCETLDFIEKRGKEQGIKEGIKEGIEQGLDRGISIFIQDKVEDGIPKERIVEKVMKSFDMDEAKAQEYVKKYGKV